MPTRVAAVQLPFTFFGTPQEFSDYVRVPIETAAEHGAQLILLPHLTSLMLFGMFDAEAQAGERLDALAARQQISTREWLDGRAGYVFEFYLHLFQSFASRVEVWLAPGTILEPENDALYLSLFLLNPAGEIVGRQRQMQPGAREIEWGVQRGDTLRVFETEVGDLGFVIAEDIQHPEIALGLVQNGANLLLHPAALGLDGWDATKSSSELRDDVRDAQSFAMQATLVGGKFRGGSAIYAPAELSGSKSGILAQAIGNAEGEILLADLDFEALKQLRAAHPTGS